MPNPRLKKYLRIQADPSLVTLETLESIEKTASDKAETVAKNMASLETKKKLF